MTVLFLYCAVQMPAESPRTETLMLSSTGITVVGVSLDFIGSLTFGKNIHYVIAWTKYH
jgi:hypothetical protein